DLALGHAEHEPRLFLPFRHSLDPTAVDLRKITGIVKDKRNGRRSEPSALASAPYIVLPDQYGHKITDQKLDHQRCSSDDPDDDLCKVTERFKPGHRSERDDQPQRDRSDQRHEEKLQSLQKPSVQRVDNNRKLF